MTRVHADVATAAQSYDRAAQDVTLIAVSKTFDAAAIRPVLEAGQRVFGENRVQEAQGKWPALREDFPGTELHLIGPLQSNKAKDAVALFDVIHTVDREKIAKALRSEMEKADRELPVFIQINTGAEPQKAGVAPSDAPDFISYCIDDLKLDVAGLMCIPPIDDTAAIHFGFLATLAERHGLAGLSMGMSADYETAIQFGATHVRVGSAIFGARTPPAK
ncbi:MAG: YggS family pyridoxal phosphate-dependent enzyme [Pseudomonadota bacterium]